MKAVCFFIGVLLIPFGIQAQTDSLKTTVLTSQKTEPPKVFAYVEQMPEFPGGDYGLINFLQQNIHYPELERENDVQGKVLLRFVVDEEGKVGDVVVVRSVSRGLDSEAVRVTRLLPNFKPGMQQGKYVKVYYNLPVLFKLTDNTKTRPSTYDTKTNKDEDFREGIADMKQNSLNAAIKYFSLSIKHFPNDYLGYLFRGSCESRLKKLKDACNDYKKAKELGSPDADEYLKKNCK